ncbi:unnamed protein product, partial [Nesidiocoris tenuis]
AVSHGRQRTPHVIGIFRTPEVSNLTLKPSPSSRSICRPVPIFEIRDTGQARFSLSSK